MTDRIIGALVRRTPTVLLLVVLPLIGAVRLAVFVAVRWWLLWPLFVAALVWRLGPATVGAVAGGVVVLVGFVLAYWQAFAPESFARRVGDPVRGALRARRYRRAWDDAMEGCKLVRGEIVPTLMSCRTHGGVDRLSVHMAPGQVAADWREVAPRVAGALGVRSVRVRADGPRDVALLVRWREIRSRDAITVPEIDEELAETTEQLVHERETAEPEVPARAFPRRPR